MPSEIYRPRVVISLGAWCQVTHQMTALGYNVGSSPFDWLVTPLPSLLMMLDDDLASVGLGASPSSNGRDAIDNEYGCMFAHEFHHNQDGTVIITKDALKICRSKLLHKYKKMKTICNEGGGVLFVRMGGYAEPAVAWPYLSDEVEFDSAAQRKLDNFLLRLCPSGDFKVLLVNFRETTKISSDEIPKNFIISHLAWPVVHPAIWEGESDAWRVMLEHSGIDRPS